MRREGARETEGSFSFLDVIACAFGAIVLLVLILPVGHLAGPDAGRDVRDYGALLLQLAEREAVAKARATELGAVESRRAALDALLSRNDVSNKALRELVAATQAETTAVTRRVAAARRAVEAATARRSLDALGEEATEAPEPTEYAGIPVDSEYVAIVVDTSGSMRMIWDKVMREVRSVLAIYPEIKGFQILDASGHYLSRPGRWIPDTDSNRRIARASLQGWFSSSYSNPERGILTAVRNLYRPGIKMAVFVFGDDYVGTDYEPFLDAVQAGVARHASGGGALRIHAFGFRSPAVDSTQRLKYAILMRELTRHHDGAFLALSG